MTVDVAVRLEVETNADAVREFAESLTSLRSSARRVDEVPRTFPVRWLAAAGVRERVAAAAGSTTGALFQTGASFAYRAPLRLDTRYALAVRIDAGLAGGALSVEADLAGLDGAPVAHFSLQAVTVTGDTRSKPARKMPASSPDELPPLPLGSFSAAEVLRYASVSGDDNPIHRDLEYARAVGLPERVVQGMLLFGRLAATIGDWQRDARLTRTSVRFLRPVLIDEPVLLRGRIMRRPVPDSGSVLRIFVVVDGDALVAVAEADLNDAG